MFQKIQKRIHRNHVRPFKLIQIESSMGCNLECVMCPWISIHRSNKLLSPETFSRAEPYLSQADAVDFTGGGEPLLNPDLLKMVRTSKNAGCEVGFSTNGTLLDRSLAEAVIEVGLDWLSFSFDAATPATYHKIRQGSDFDTVIGNITTLRDLKLTKGSNRPKLMMVFVMMTGIQENYHELPEFIDLAHSLGVEQVTAKNLDVITKDGDFERGLFDHNGQWLSDVESIRVQAQTRAEDLGIELRLYNLKPQEQVICEQYPTHNLYINWAGNLSPCITLSYAENRFFNGEKVHVPCQIYGNINQETIGEIWGKPEYSAFREIYKERLNRQKANLMQAVLGSDNDLSIPQAPEGCQTCYYLYGI